MSWLLLQGWLLIFNVLGKTESYVSCRVVVLTALCVVRIICAATARTMYDALTVVDICLYIVTRTLVSSASRVSRNWAKLIRVSVSAISWTKWTYPLRAVQSFDSFVTTNSELINAFVEDYRLQYGSIRIHVRADSIFTREVDDGYQRVPAYFTSTMQDIDSTQQIDLQRVAADLSAQADYWNSRGSGFVLERIVKFVLCITHYRPLHESTYIPTPQWLAKKHCVVNVKNSDPKCFLWSVLAALLPPKYNSERMYNYKPYENSLDISGLTFPLAVKDVPKFEKQNPSISVNVLCLSLIHIWRCRRRG